MSADAPDGPKRGATSRALDQRAASGARAARDAVPGAGRAALFSAATRRPGTLVVECGACRARSRVSYADLARRSLPVGVWLPWRKHSRLARCPACEQRTWLAARWFD